MLAVTLWSVAPVHAAEPKALSDLPSVDVSVEHLDDGWQQSKKDLAKAYSALLEREEVSLGSDLDDRAASVANAWIEELSGLSWQGWFVRVIGPILALLLLLGALFGLDRRLMRAAHKAHVQVDYHSLQWVNALHQTLLVTAARVVPVLIVIAASYFPVQAIFARAPWTQAVSGVLWVLLVWRLLQGFVVGALGFGLIDLKDETARRLWGVLSWNLRVGLAWLAVLQASHALAAPDDVADWVKFLALISVALVSTSLLSIREEVAQLVAPNRGDSERLPRYVRRYYSPIVLATVTMLGLGAIGYWNAATFILTRVYGVLLLFFATVRVSHLISDSIANRVQAAESEDEADLYMSLGRMVRVATFVVLAAVTVKVFLLEPAIKAILGAPLLTLGRVQIAPLHIIDGMLVIFVAVLISRAVRAALLGTVYPRLGIDVGVGYAINALLNYAFIVIGFFVGLSVLGVDLSSLTVVIASLGVGIGLGLQTLTENLVSGFILLFGRSVKKGDVVTVNGLYGRVEDVGARSVVIRTPDNYDMLVPSKSLVNGEVVNWSFRDPFVRIHLPVRVSYHSNPRHVEQVLLQAAHAHPKVLRDPAPEVWLVEFGSSSVNFELLVYYDLREITMNRLRGQLNFVIWDKLKEAGIEIPFPQQDVHLRTAEAFPELTRAVEKLSQKLGGED